MFQGRGFVRGLLRGGAAKVESELGPRMGSPGLGEGSPLALGPKPVTLAISTLDRPLVLRETLDALGDVDLDLVLEVLIVDQSDTPLDPSPWRDALPIRVVPQRARGLGVSRNEVIAQAKTEIVLFLDDDVVPEPGLVREHLRVYRERPRCVGVAGYEKIGSPSARRAWRGLVRRALVRGLGPYLRWRREYARFLDPEGQPVGLVLRSGLLLCDFSRRLPCRVMTPRGCNMSFRRDVLLAVGGFDPACVGPRRDETDLALRISEAMPDAELWFSPGARLTHWMTPSGGCRTGDRRERMRRDLACELQFARRHLRPLGRALCILRLVLARLPALLRYPSLVRGLL